MYKLSLNEATELMDEAGEKYSVERFTDYHYRVENQIDIYPTTSKYNILATSKTGNYSDLYMFLKDNIKLPEAETKTIKDPNVTTLNIFAFDLKTLKNVYLFGFVLGASFMIGVAVVAFVLYFVQGI